MQNKKDIANKSNSKMKAFLSAKQAETGHKKSIRTIIRALPFAIGLIFKSAPFLLILLGLINILPGLMPTAMVYVDRLVLDAIMKRPSVIIFDEPTTSLDIETEPHLFREITRLTKNKFAYLSPTTCCNVVSLIR